MAVNVRTITYWYVIVFIIVYLYTDQLGPGYMKFLFSMEINCRICIIERYEHVPIFLPVFAATIEKLGGMATKFSTRGDRTTSLPIVLVFPFYF